MVFEQKKIQVETLSEYLSEIRKSLNLPAEEVCKNLGISSKFLAALELGNFKTLPADVYVYGFLRQLAKLYAVNADDLILQYKKERGIDQQLAKNLPASKPLPGPLAKVVITPKLLSVTLGLAFVVLSVGYIIWQVWSINKTPALEIFEPSNNAVIEGSSLQVKGKTDIGARLTVNDQSVFVDSNGQFQSVLSLNPGQAQITIVAKNRFDKSVSKTLNLTGKVNDQAAAHIILELKLDFSGDVNLTAAVDNSPAENFIFKDGDSKSFTAQQKILLSTTDAGATKAIVNGQSLGALGRKGEQLNNIPFFAQSDNMK